MIDDEDKDDPYFGSPVYGMTCDEHMEQYLHVSPFVHNQIGNFIKTVLHRLQVKGEPCGAIMRLNSEVLETEWHVISQTDAKPTLFLP